MRPSRVALTAGAVAVLCGGVGFVLGRTIESPADAAAGAKAPKASLIGAPVEFEQLSANLVVRGTIGAVGATQMTLAASKIGKTDNIVVRAAERGATINEGDVFAVIGDRPVIVLQGDLPVYRDLQPGNQGEDVLLLENALARLDLDPGDVDGTYDSSTEGAVSRLYENRGFKAIGPTAEEQARIDDLTKQESTARAAGNAADASKASEDLGKLLDSTGPSVPANELIFASVLPAKVESVNVKRGSTVDGPIATLASSESVVQTSIARADRNLVEVGAAAKIDITDLGQTIDGKVLTIAPQTGTDGAGESRYAVTVQSADIPQDSLGLGVRITIPVKSTDGEVLAVPAAALTIDEDGDASVDVIDDSGDKSSAVKVETGLQAKGMVEVKPVEGTLEKGDFVVVGAESAAEATSDSAVETADEEGE